MEDIKNIIERLEKLEKIVFSPDNHQSSGFGGAGKQKTLREVVRGKYFRNGQERVAAVVGYHEKVLRSPIHKDKIEEGWISAKMDGDFAPIYLTRAKGDLIRVAESGICDLTQTGEDFFEKILKDNESSRTAP